MPWRCLAMALLAAALSGCVAPQATLRTLDEGLPLKAELRNTPFFAQQDYQCGPAALAMVLAASGVPATPEALLPKVYLPGRQGSLQLELVAASRQYDRLAYEIEPELSHLAAEVAAGHPVLVMQNLGVAAYPLWHFAVVVGYDRTADQLLLRSGTTERLVMGAQRFLGTWNRAERWAMVLLEPGTLPATPEPGRYFTAAAALEATGRLDAASRAYARGAGQWPESTVPLLGLANVAYARGDLVGAIQAYDEVLRRDSRNVVARHNLAEALSGLGCVAAARREIRVAQQFAEQSAFTGQIAATARRLDELPEPAESPALCQR